MSKLKSSDIINIRKLYNEKNISQKEIAKLYNVSYSNINMIITRKIWSHVK